MNYRDLRQGQVVRVTLYGGMECDAYVVVDDLGHDTSDTIFLCGDKPYNTDQGRHMYLERVGDDEFVHVRPEELTDELCRLVALYQLGALTEGEIE